MKDEKASLADAIVDAAHIISNNRAVTPGGSALGGLEAHSMKIAESNNNIAYSIDGLAHGVHQIANELSRLVDLLERQKNA